MWRWCSRSFTVTFALLDRQACRRWFSVLARQVSENRFDDQSRTVRSVRNADYGVRTPADSRVITCCDTRTTRACLPRRMEEEAAPPRPGTHGFLGGGAWDF